MDNLNLQKIEGYTVQLVAEKVWAIDEFGTDIIYLVEGNTKAAVIDTGAGFGNLKAVIETLTKLPYIVLNTHGHLDHIGGNYQFGSAYLNELDFKMANTEKLQGEWNDFVKKAKKEPGFYGNEYLQTAHGPKEFKKIPLKNKQILDLGGRSLEVFFVPGHTWGSVVFLDRENRILFSGDSIVSTPILIFDTYSANVKEFKSALIELEKEEFDIIFPGHYLRPVGRKTFLDLIVCAEKIINGTAVPKEVDFSHMSSEVAVLYQYGNGSIVFNDKHIS